jgi:hypothetical protein
MEADNDIGVGTLFHEKRNPSLVGLQKSDLSETTDLVINPIVVLAGIRRYPKPFEECL